MLTIYFMRHGESQANVERVFANGNDGYPLTALGRSQAETTGKFFESKKIRSVYTSPILRARETASIIGRKIGVEPIVLDHIREFSVGKLEGESISGEAESTFLSVAKEWLLGNKDARIPGGESQREIIERFYKALERILEENNEGEVLLVTHGGFMSVSIPFVCEGLDVKTFFSNSRVGVENCGIVTLTAEKEGADIKLNLIDWAGKDLS